ncbi:MAG TPA: alpha/beta fold hydrolase, partial [Chloroflexota bacterium]|nr:alpha/beta fold hydrolase [Chloroflexota bacterium]
MAQPAEQRLTWEERDVPVGDRRIHLRRAAGDGPPLLLLHGLGVSGAVWQALARRLFPTWSPIAPDLPGHGESDPAGPGPPGAPGGPGGYTPEALADAVGGLLDALGIERIPVGGHSLGALVALALAVYHPQRVTGVVLLDPPLDSQRRNPDVAEVYRLREAPSGALEDYLARTSGSPLAARALAPIYRAAQDGAFEAHLQAQPGAPWAWAEAPHVTAPVLLVQADPALGGVLGDEAA